MSQVPSNTNVLNWFKQFYSTMCPKIDLKRIPAGVPNFPDSEGSFLITLGGALGTSKILECL